MREVSFGKRLLSMVLALVMIVGMVPVANISGWFTKANAADGTSTGTKTPVDAAIMFSDLHTSQTDYKQEELEAIMSAFKYTGMPYSSVTSCGDAFSVNEDDSYSNGPYDGYSDTLVGYIQGTNGLGDSSVNVNFVWSDHDRYVYNNATDRVMLDKTSHLAYGAGNDGTYGTADDANYYVYTLSMADLCSYDRYEAGFNYTTSTNNRAENGFTATVEEAIANFKADAAKLDKSKPLLIASHQPLFDNRNDNAWAEDWFDAINEVAAEMDVVFFYGHNHKYDSGSDYYYGKGSTMPVATADNWGFDYDVGEGYLPSMDLSSENKTLNFTHMCAGYLEPTSTGSYSSSTTRLGTAISIVIYEDSLVLQTYDADGLYTGNFAVNETVTRDHAVTEPETPNVELKDEETGVIVSAPELSTLAVKPVTTKPAAVEDLLEGDVVAYDITVTGFSGTASVTINIPEGMDAAKFAVFYVPENGVAVKMPGAASEDGKTYTFTTTHFSVYVGGQLASGTTVGTGAEDTGVLQGGTRYVLDTDGVDDGATYLIVSASSGNAYAFRNNSGSSARQSVSIDSNVIDAGFSNESTCTWTFTASGTSWYISNGDQRVRLSDSDILNGTGQTLTVTSQGNGAYRINSGYYYLRHRNNSWQRYYSAGNVYLFKQVTEDSNTEVTFKLQNTTEMYNEDTQNLIYEITLSNGTTVSSYEITWESGANTYLTVTNGKMTATNKATTTQETYVKATLTSVNGTALVTPIELQVPVVVKPYTVTFDVAPENAELLVNQTKPLVPTVTYNGVQTNDYTISWSTSDPSIATVSSDGVVTAVSEGMATITVTVSDINGKNTSVTRTVSISVIEKEAQSIAVTPTTITVERDTLTTAPVGTIIVDYGDGDVRKVPLTLGMLEGNKNLAENGIYENLSVTYAGQTATGITLKVVDKSGDNYPEYPNQGSVKVDKTADATYLQNYGVVNVELSTSGLPVSKGVDVIVMLDLSSSMTRCIDHDTKNCTQSGCSGTRLEALQNALVTFQTELNKSTNKDNIRVAIADFNVFYTSGPSAYDSSDYIEGSFSASGENTIYTGDNEIGIGAFEPATKLDVTSYNLTVASGTNYDYAFDTIYQLGTAVREDNAAKGQEDRELVVLFMSDGAANQFNFYRSTGGTSAEDPTYGWNFWLDGTMTADDLKSTSNGGMLNSATHAYYYDSVDHDGDGHYNEHRMANAIKGDPNKMYEVIRKSAQVTSNLTLEGAKDSDGNTLANMYMAPGLGATLYAVAFDIANDGPITDEAIFASLEQIPTSDEYYVNAASEDDLKNAFQKFASDITYAATSAYYVDQMGDSFNLQMGNTVSKRENDGSIVEVALPVAPKIQVLNYNIYKASDVNGTTVTEAMVGKRYGDPIVVEEITFNDEGTEAYSTLDSIGPNGETITAGSNIYIDGVIYAKNFYYNNNLTSVKVNNGTITVEPETFRWNIGIINNVEWALNYWTYLAGSMEGQTSSGSYKTNNYAILYYKNWLGNNAFQATTSPQVGWESANVSYAFYLVDSQGRPVVNQTTGQTGNFINAVKVTNPVVFDEIMLNNLDDIDTIEASSLTVLPSGYKLYDETASYKVVVLSSDGKGSWTITYNSALGENTSYVTGHAGTDATNETKVTGSQEDDEGNPILTDYTLRDNYDYTHTTVWFAVVWVPQALPDAVVIDYGLPVDISVLVNDQFGQNGTLKGVGSIADKNIALESAEGTNIYTDKHSDAFGDKITSTYGTAETFGAKVRYTPTTMDWGTGDVAFDKFAYEVEYDFNQYDADGNHVADLGTQYYYGDVTVIPATSVYYEDTFMTYEGDWSVISNNASITQDEDRPGKYSISQIDKNNVYGYDSHYTAMSEYSLGNVHHITVNKGTFGRASFTFHGTGFDVISLTSNKTGTLAIKVTAAEDIYEGETLKFEAGAKAKAVIVDTYYGYTKDADGKWVTTTTDPNPLYQIPVMKIEDLPYGKYDVVITATYGEAYDHTDDAGYELYLDAIRIYDPAGDGSDLAIDEDGTARDKTIADIYAQDGEGWPIYEELRNQLIDEDTYKTAAGSDTYKGMIFIDSNGENASVTDYTNLGPNNELYLAAGQTVAFELDLSQYIVDKVINDKTVKQSIIADVQLGVKSADGKQVKVTLTADNVSASREFSTSTDMYYSFSQLVDLGTDTTGEDTANDSKTIVYIQNSNPEDSEGLVSITNIKVTFKQQPAAQEDSQFLFWSRNIGEAVLTMLQSASSNDKEPEVEQPVPEESKPEGETPEESKPEGETPEESKPEDEIPEESKPENETPKDEETGDNTTEDSDSDESVDPNPETGSRLSYIIGMITRFFRNIFGWIFN